MNLATAAAPDPNPCPDADLARAVAAGDRGAFGVMMKRYNQLLYRTARSVLRDDADAEDAVQDAWLRAWRAMGSFRAEARLSTWLVRIAVNEALGRLRAAPRRADVIPLDTTHDAESLAAETIMQQPEAERPESMAERAELRCLLEGCIDELPAAFRTVFVLRAVHDMSVEEAAASLGLPEATVRTRHFRARAMLRASLARGIDLAIEDAFSFAGARCDRISARVFERLDAERRDGG
jgi:RNA polymerase sigma-70 factor (ECF subfamily)